MKVADGVSRARMVAALCLTFLAAPCLMVEAQQIHPAGIRVDLAVPFVPPIVSAEGDRHLLYELHINNFGSAELKLVRIEILDDSTSAILALEFTRFGGRWATWDSSRM
jgi:hypothetical protein